MKAGRRVTRTRVVASWSAALVAGICSAGVLLAPATAEPLPDPPVGSATVATEPTADAPESTSEAPRSGSVTPSPAPDDPTTTPSAEGPGSAASPSPTAEPPTSPAAQASDLPTTPSSTGTPTSPVPGSGSSPSAGGSSVPDPVDSDPVDPGPIDPTPVVQAPVAWSVRALAATSDGSRSSGGSKASESPESSKSPAPLPVTVRTVCQAVVFANPDPGHPVVVALGDFSRVDPDKTITIPAAGVVRVPVSRSWLDWAAGRLGTDDGRLGALGRGDHLSVDQECAAPRRSVMAVVSSPCLARRQPVTVLTTGADPDAELSWWVSRQGSPLTVTDGVLTPGRSNPVDMDRFGPGRYELTVANGTTVLDRADFAVQDCVTTAADCSAVTWDNPSGNSAVTVAFRDGSSPSRTLRLAPGQSARVVTAGLVRWAATASLSAGSRLSDAGAETKVAVADACPADSTVDSVGTSGTSTLDPSVAAPTTRPVHAGHRPAPWWPVGAVLLTAGTATAASLAVRTARRRRQ